MIAQVAIIAGLLAGIWSTLADIKKILKDKGDSHD